MKLWYRAHNSGSKPVLHWQLKTVFEHQRLARVSSDARRRLSLKHEIISFQGKAEQNQRGKPVPTSSWNGHCSVFFLCETKRIRWRGRHSSSCEDAARRRRDKKPCRAFISIKASVHSKAPKMNSSVGERVVSKISKKEEWDNAGEDGEEEICRFIAEERDRHWEREKDEKHIGGRQANAEIVL